MLITLKKITDCLGEVKNIREQYSLYFIGSDTTERSVNRLLKLCRESLGKNIELSILSESSLNHLVHGFCIVSDDGYEICILSDLNNCWKRFVICKELCHVILDCPEFRNLSLNEHVEDFTAGTLEPFHQACESAQAENLAEIAAMEFLFPYSERVSLVNSGEPLKFIDIAERYKVPRYYIEKYLSERYMNIFKKVYS